MLLALSTIYYPGYIQDEAEINLKIGRAFDHDTSYETLVIDESETVIWKNRSIFIESWLYVEGNLILENTTLEFGKPAPGINSLILSGMLKLRDLDNDKRSEQDASLIRVNDGGVIDIIPGNMVGQMEVNSSRIEGTNITGINIRVIDSIFRNSSIWDINYNSLFKNSQFKGAGNGVGLSHEKRMWTHIHGCVFEGYQTAINLTNGSIGIKDSLIMNNSRGIFTGVNSTLAMENCSMRDSAESIISNGEVTIRESTFQNTTLDFNGNEANILSCSFQDNIEVKEVANGLVRDSSFHNCSICLKDLVSTKVIKNSFSLSENVLVNVQNCKIYHNVFSGNGNTVSGPPKSIFYNETLGEGNYWSSYSGLDNGQGGRRPNDGIGDTDIPYLQRDPYPFMMPDYLERPEIPGLLINYQSGTDVVSLNALGDGTGLFVFQRSTSSSFTKDLVTWSSEKDRLTIKDNPNGTIYFRVGLYNDLGSRGWSKYRSIKIDDSPLPPEDIEISPVPEGEGLKLEWRYVGKDIRSVVLTIQELESGFEIPSKVVSYPNRETTVTDLENGVTYSIALFTRDMAGNPSETTKNVTGTPQDTVPPNPPGFFDGSPESNQSIILHWRTPTTQDIKGYILFRKGPDDITYEPLMELTEKTLNFTDTGLEDNTTYEYGIKTIDDDGPLSEMAGPVKIRTFHNNNPPNQTSARAILELEEDGTPATLDLGNLFMDVDGDELTFKIKNGFRFQSELVGDMLRIVPKKDQEGEGYIDLVVSDGEESVSYIIPVIIKPVPDAPRNVRITNPLNGSTIKPGVSHLLAGYAYDPDEGDRITISWNSSIDGVLISPRNIGSNSDTFADYVLLSPGVHLITLVVWDSWGNQVKTNVTVAVSLWGFSEIPWSLSLVDDKTSVTQDQSTITLEIVNNGPLLLSFAFNASLKSDKNQTIGTPIEGSLIVLPPGSSGTVVFKTDKIPSGEEVFASFSVEAKTLNGTFAGRLEKGFEIGVTKNQDGDRGITIGTVLLVLGILLFLVVVSVAIVIIFALPKGERN